MPLTNDHREMSSRAAKAKLLNERNNWTELESYKSTVEIELPLLMREEFTPNDKDQPCKLIVSMHTLCYYPMSPSLQQYKKL